MNTQLDINEQLIQQALLVAGINNPQNVIELALTEFIARRKNDRLSQAFGKYHWEGDLEQMRMGQNVTDR